MRSSLALLALLLLAPVSSAQAQFASGENALGPRSSVVSFRDSTGNPALEVRLEISAGELSFVKEGEGYLAEVDVAITILTEDDEQVTGDIWRRRVSVGRYEDLSNSEPVLTERRSFRVPRGRYRVKVELHDLNSDQSRSRMLFAEALPGQEPGEVGMSDLEFGALGDSSGPARRTSITPVVRRVFGNPLPRLAVYGEVYVDSTSRDSVDLRVEVRDEGGRRLEQAHMTLLPDRGVAPFLLRPAFERLAVGDYVLWTEARSGKKKARREQQFAMDETRVDFGPHFSDLLEAVALVAGDDDLDSLRQCPEGLRPACWSRFWQRREGGEARRVRPNVQEFFQRLRYTSQHFSTPAVGPGWRTDMGRVYLKYGAPDQTEVRPQTATEFASQIWYYNDSGRLMFVFIDRSGFGHYELASQRGGG